MNKSELIDVVAQNAGVTKASAGEVVEATLDAIADALSGGDSVALVGFGTFSVRERGARTGRNPRTGESIAIAASRIPAFKAGKALKDEVA